MSRPIATPLLVAATCVSLGATAGLCYAVGHRRAQIFGRSAYRGPGDRRSIALTFDDGPSQGSLEIAAYLKEQSVQATFFHCGVNVLRNPGIARYLHAAGHEIGNHTFSHARLCPRLSWQPNLLSPEAIYEEFAHAQEIISREILAFPRLLRAPYGLRWRGLGRTQQRLDLLGVMWTVIAHDWEWSGRRVAEHVLHRATAGGIVCLHDGRDTQPNPDVGSTIEALHRIVPKLKERGFSFETVSSILQPRIQNP